jgi:broad specificity phosphatase PhoE
MSLLVLCRHVAPDGDTAELARRVAAYEPDAVVASGLARAVRTAEAFGLPVEVDDRLREIDFGEVEGFGFDELPAWLQSELLASPTTARFPGGETYGDLRERVVEALTEITARHDRVAVVSHAGAIRAALATFLAMDESALWRLDQRLGALNVVEFVEGVPVVRLLNG